MSFKNLLVLTCTALLISSASVFAETSAVSKKDCSLDVEIQNELDLDYQAVVKLLKRKNFIVAPKNEAKYSIQNFSINCHAGAYETSKSGIGGERLAYCDEMYTSLTIRNNVSGETSQFDGQNLSLSYKGITLKGATTKKAIADLVSKIATCE